MPRWRDLVFAAWRTWRLLDWRSIRRQAETPLRLALLGDGPAMARVESLLQPADHVTRGPLDMPPPTPLPDLVVLAPSESGEPLARAGRVAREVDDQGGASLVLVPPAAGAPPAGVTHLLVDPAAPDVDERLAAGLLDALPEERRLAAARSAPGLRQPLARRLTHEHALANAQFALVANLPSLLPGPGTAAGLGADMLVLTTNQIVLVFKLAALWGENLGKPQALIAEIAPVVGGAFVWRTASRALVGVLPAFTAVAPKVAIAYVGTYVVGGLASAYYHSGQRPTEGLIREIEREARQGLTLVWERLRPADMPTDATRGRRITVEPAAAPSAPPSAPHAGPGVMTMAAGSAGQPLTSPVEPDSRAG